MTPALQDDKQLYTFISLIPYTRISKYPYHHLPHTPRPEGRPPQGGNPGMLLNFL